MKKSGVGIVLLCCAVLTVGTAWGAVIDLIQKQAQHPNLIHQWSFEGATDAERRENKKGTIHTDIYNRNWTLDPDDGIQGSEDDPVQEFVPGFDYSTTASRSYSVGNNSSTGSALRLASNIVMPLQGTVEFMIYHNDTLYGTSIGGSGGTDNRWTFSQGRRIMIGPNATTGDLLPSDYAGKWYYGAVTWEIDTTGYDRDGYANNPVYAVTVNGWYADLSGEAPFALVHSVQDAETWVNDYEQAIRFGLGAVSGSSSILDGMTDAFAMYDTILPQATLESHVSLIPEPGSAVLLLGALVTGILLQRRRNRR